MTNLNVPDLLTVQQFADLFQLCRQSVYKLIREGKLTAFKNPIGKYLIPRKCVEKLLDGCYTVGATNACGCPMQGGISNVG